MAQNKIFLSMFILTLLLFSGPVTSEVSEKSISIELVSNVSLINDNIEGDGKIIDPPRDYLFEGEKIVFDMLVYDPMLGEKTDKVVVTLGTEPIPGNDVEVDCFDQTIIDETHINYHCDLTIETPDSMYGQYWVGVDIISNDGEHVYEPIELFFLNPVISLNFNQPPINFPDVRSGQKAYSEPVSIKNDVDQDSNVLLNMYLTRASSGFDIFYYAENGEYNTTGDPRADKEGFVNLESSDIYDIEFWNQSEIIQIPGILELTPPFYYPENILGEGEEMSVIFRIDIPKEWKGQTKSGSVIAWGAADSGWGPSTGVITSFSLNVPDADCFVDLECDDGNSKTDDVCVMPGTSQSYCENNLNMCKVSDLNNDKIVNWGDFSVFVNHWAERNCREPDWCGGADIDNGGEVTWNDFAIFSDCWLYSY